MKKVLLMLFAVGGLLALTAADAQADHWRRGRGSNFSISVGSGYGYGSGFQVGYNRGSVGRWGNGPWIGGVSRGPRYGGGYPVYVPVPRYGYSPIYQTFPNYGGWYGYPRW